jgi:GNAT superfamily N-acetyltransferase
MNGCLPAGLREAPACEPLVCSAFDHQPQVRQRSLVFLAAGYIGFLVMNGRQCVSRAWMCTPASRGPRHLPRSFKSANAYWIVYCATELEYRGQGLYKYCLQRLIHRARRDNPQAAVLIDTAVDNVPSRRAIRSVGFQPYGVIVSYRVPKTEIVFGRWRRSDPHPELIPTLNDAIASSNARSDR